MNVKFFTNTDDNVQFIVFGTLDTRSPELPGYHRMVSPYKNLVTGWVDGQRILKADKYREMSFEEVRRWMIREDMITINGDVGRYGKHWSNMHLHWVTLKLLMPYEL